MRIGVVDLDSSHPQNWIPLEREMGHEIVGVWDGGSVHPREYVLQFAKDHRLSRVFESLEEMSAEVDCAVIHGCDWDTHVAKARPFIEAGKAVLIDKPLAGNLADLRQFQRWAREGARVAGGSSLRFCREVKQFLARPPAERGNIGTAICGYAVDEFNYGIHAHAMLSAVFGSGVAGVRNLGGQGQRRVQVNWADGRVGIVVAGAAREWLPFYGTIVTDREVAQFQVDLKWIYRDLLEATLPYLAGQTARPAVPMDELIEPELCALAARKSWNECDRVVQIDELQEDDAGYDGKAFAAGYRRGKYPGAKEREK